MTILQTPVLIVGGGPVGLALALELAWQGCESMVVERKPGTESELLAKAGTLSERTMEFCRRWGIRDAVANWGADDDYPRDTVYCTALRGHFIGRDEVASANKRKTSPAGPEILRKCPQHVFDPLLARTVEATGKASIRYGTELRSLTQDGRGVDVELADLGSGEPLRVRAGYVVACDGAGSSLRQSLGIRFPGTTLDYSASAMLRIENLHSYHPLGKATRYLFIDEHGGWANLTSVDYGALWRFTLLGGEETLAIGTEAFRAAIDKAFGAPVPYELMRVLPWRRSQCVADRYVAGRVVLAGDAAHTMSPTGGHGLNTGLGDVVGLGWMLAALTAGWGGAGLLSAYESERRPVALRNGASSTRNYEAWIGARGTDYSRVMQDGPQADAARALAGRQLSEMLKEEWHSLGIRMGYRYEGSPLVVPDGTPEPPDEISTYVPTARPGHRAPHAWLEPGRSTLDLFGKGFVLLAFGAPAGEAEPLASAARARGMPLTRHDIADRDIHALYGARHVLVRPDGHVAWRGEVPPSDCADLVDRVRGAGR